MLNEMTGWRGIGWFVLALATPLVFGGVQAAPAPQQGRGKMDRLMFSEEQIPVNCQRIEGLFPADAQTRMVYDQQIRFLPPLVAKRHQSFQCGSQKGTIYFFLYASTGHGNKALSLVQPFLWGSGGPHYLHPSITLTARNAFIIFSFKEAVPGIGPKLVVGPAEALWAALEQRVKDLNIAEANEVQKLKQEIGDYPDDFGRRVRLGKAILNSGDSKVAMVEFRAALRLGADAPIMDRELGIALRTIGIGYGKAGRNADGIDALRMAILVNPSDARAHIALGHLCSKDAAYLDFGISHLRAFAQKIPQTEKETAEANFYLALIFNKKGREREALESYEIGLIADPEDHFILNGAAWLYVTANDQQLRDPPKAVQYAEKAVQAIKGPARPNYLDTLARAYYENNELEKAVAAIQEAITLAPRNKGYQEQLRLFEQAQERARREPDAAELPTPLLVMTGTEEYQVRGPVMIRFDLRVVNWSDFPAQMFAPAPDLPPCGTNKNSSRTWVRVYAEDGTQLYGFCGFRQPSSGYFWFAVPKGEAPPDRVYIVLMDRLQGEAYRSNLVSTQSQSK